MSDRSEPRASRGTPVPALADEWRSSPEHQAARLIVVNGRWWLAPLPERDIEHAALCIQRDPKYRQELMDDASNHARRDLNDLVLAGELREAKRLLDGRKEARRA